ncbi:hypothetical protein CH272_05860 [Rhodococcus sp. 05-340-1]|nr:hypothetical protein CH271_15025 [Rhodococcus sp. 05-340-2]OZD80410.1 hypothetical protein CH272_05860 [Rhodococcus sp. 05-340-1]
MSALPRRGGALPGEPTVPESAPRAAPTITAALPTVTATTNAVENAALENANRSHPANAQVDRAGRIDAALAVASSDPSPTAGRLAPVVPDGPRPTSRSQCSRSSSCW